MDAVLLLALELDAATIYARDFLDETVLSVFNQVIILNHFFIAAIHGASHLHGIQVFYEEVINFFSDSKLFFTA